MRNSDENLSANPIYDGIGTATEISADGIEWD
jgi:hypothetical protein